MTQNQDTQNRQHRIHDTEPRQTKQTKKDKRKTTKTALKHQKSIKSFCDVSVNIHSCVFRVQSISCQGHSFSFTFNVKLYLYDNVLKYIYVYKATFFVNYKAGREPTPYW
jgi:hypothetical protein